MRTTNAHQRPRKRAGERWSGHVTRHSNALDLVPDIFKMTNAKRIAASLKESAKKSTRRKGTPYQSAMSMLNFYINRAGSNLPRSQKRVLEQAKAELRTVFHRRSAPASR